MQQLVPNRSYRLSATISTPGSPDLHARFERLCRTLNYKHLRNSLGKLLSGRYDLVEEFLQETLANIWRCYDRSGGQSVIEGQFQQLVYASASNLIISWSRPKFNRSIDSLNQLSELAIEPKTHLESEIENSVLRLISQLNPRRRRVLSLLVKGYSYNEIAEILGCTENAVKGRIHQSRLELWRKIQADRDELERC